jgi:hypothetical protein
MRCRTSGLTVSPPFLYLCSEPYRFALLKTRADSMAQMRMRAQWLLSILSSGDLALCRTPPLRSLARQRCPLRLELPTESVTCTRVWEIRQI